jgi:hypothetical protein
MAATQQKKNRRNNRRPRDNQPVTTAPAPAAPTPAAAWVSNVPSDDAEIVGLPSGNAARIRHVAPEAFLEQGLIPDPLTAIVDKAIKSKKGLRPADERKMTDDPAKVGAMLEMMDRIVCFSVVEPKVVMPPVCVICHEHNTARAKQHQDETHNDYHPFEPEERKDGVLYVDKVDSEDKMFIMNWAMGGTRDLERFRRQHRASVDRVSAGQGESHSAQ